MKPSYFRIVHILFFLTLISFIGCQNDVRDINDNNGIRGSEKSPVVLRKELVDIEKGDPLKYLSVKATWRKNIIGETVIEGTISNNATLAIFKDVNLKITWLTQTNTVLNSITPQPIYDYFRPHESRLFKYKFRAPSAMAGFEYEILSATSVE